MAYKKKLRHLCHYCQVKYKGRKGQKYCSGNCRQLAYLSGKRYGYMAALKDMLEVELSYLKGKELDAVVRVCSYVVRKVLKK